MHDPRAIIHTSHLNHILDINKTSHFALVEPNVSMEKLLKETLKHGLMPPVVPSFPGLTIGGTFSGTAGSSSSFRHGFFDQAVGWIEVLLPDGSITRASRTRNCELLDGMVGSLGTLGIVTLLQIKLVRVAKCVELSHLPVKSDTEALETLEEFSKHPDTDFLEAMLYGPKIPHSGVIVVGKLTTASHHPQVILDHPTTDWFYNHALRSCGTTEYVPISAYLFRHDRGALNLGLHCFGKRPLNTYTRYLADPSLRSSPPTRTAQALHWTDHLFIQDLVVPQEAASKMLDFMEKKLGIYPLLLTPVLRSMDNNTIMRPHPPSTSMYTNISLRGSTPSTLHDPLAFKAAHRQLEQRLHQLGGFKWLYSRNYYTEAEFWEVYDRGRYEGLRGRCGAGYVQSVQSVWKKSEGGGRREVVPRLRWWERVWGRVGVVAVGRGRGGE